MRARLQDWSRPPAIATMGTVSLVVRALYAAGGAIVLISTFLPAASGDRTSWVVRAIDVAAISTALALTLLGRRMPGWLNHVTIVAGLMLIAAATAASGGGATGTAYATLFYLGVMHALFTLPFLHACLYSVGTVVLGTVVLAQLPGIGVGEQLVLWGNAVLLAVVTGFLVRAVETSEVDGATRLANRRGFERALQEMLAESQGGPVEVALIDLDHFKSYNDVHGRPAGDALLQLVARTWSTALPGDVVLGRFGGDEFALALGRCHAGSAVEVVERLRTLLPGGGSCSAGVAGSEPHESMSMLLSRADAALYTAKRNGRGRTHRQPGLGTRGTEIRTGLERGEFAVHFQPIIDLASGAVRGAEALLRWTHPQHGAVAPGDFLVEAEHDGVIVDLGAWVLQEACRQAVTWPVPASGRPLGVSVNASGRELQDPSYARTVQTALRTSGLDPRRLTVELVESRYDIESIFVASNLHALRQLGVRTAIDDFGTEYSSLDRLRRIGVDLLKIDRTFIADIQGLDDDVPMVGAMLAMAQAMKIAVVAEGVETAVQAEWLRRRGCEYGQGFLFGRAAAGAPRTGADAGAEVSVVHVTGSHRG